MTYRLFISMVTTCLPRLARTCGAGDFRCAVTLPPNVRDALTTGAWDTTGMLLDRYEEVDAASARLPYVTW